MKHGSTTSLQSQISSQLRGQQQVKAVQSDHQQARFWALYFGIHKIFCSSITLRKEELSMVNITKHYWCILKKKKSQKMPTNEKEKVLFHQDNAPCHKLITAMAKLHELHFELLPHPHYSPNLAPSDY